jgi:glutathione S-transferase
MNWIVLVTLLALLQFAFFMVLVAIARQNHGVAAPAMVGHETFERLSRVHLNTLERLMLFLPLLWLAAQAWPPQWIALIGALYLVGRILYWRGYVKEPKARMPGNILTMVPIAVLMLASLVGWGQRALA